MGKMTPTQLFDELSHIKIHTHTPQVNPSHMTTQIAACGRVRIEYRDKFIVVAPRVISPRNIKKRILKMIDTNVSINTCRCEAEYLMDDLLKRISETAQVALHNSDTSKIMDRVNRTKKEKIEKTRNDMRKKARAVLYRAFVEYNEYLNDDLIVEIWKEAVVASIMKL